MQLEEAEALLTPKELACLRLVGQLKRTKQIAAELGMSEGAVGNHCSNAARKLGVGDRASAARMLAEMEGSRKDHVTFSKADEPNDASAGTPSGRLPWPFPTKARPHNDLNATELALALSGALALLLLCAAAYLAAIAALTRN